MGKFTGHTITSDSALGAAKIKRSLRFYEPNPSDENSTAATNLTRTPSSTGNRKIWTFSSWMKKFHCIGSGNASAAYIYGAYSGSDYFSLYFQDDEIHTYYSPGNNYGTTGDRKFRDSSSWFPSHDPLLPGLRLEFNDSSSPFIQIFCTVLVAST